VWVNNHYILEYAHRAFPLEKFDTLRITGDVRLFNVTVPNPGGN